jgi:hypothetical protein
MNQSSFDAADDGNLGCAAVRRASQRQVRFTERIELFEQCSTAGSAGALNFLRVAEADLFRTIANIERDALEELPGAFENPVEYQRTALCRYVRTLRILRGSLQASLVLEIQSQSGRRTFELQNTRQDQS